MNREYFVHIDTAPPSGADSGPLSGKTVAVQQNMSVRGWPTEAGSKALEKFTALEDATVVERVRKAGARVAGSTRTSEFGFGLVGDTAAGAVSEGSVDIAFVTDTMGEARVAASGERLFGFKPTFGLVSRCGLIGLVPSMECYGIVAKTPEEIAAVMEAIAGGNGSDYSMPNEDIPDFSGVCRESVKNVRAGVITQCRELLEPEDAKSFDAALSRLEETGFRIMEVRLDDFDLFRTAHHIIGSVEASSSAGKYDGVRYGHRTASSRNWNEMYLKTRAESFGLLMKTYLFQGAYFQFENYEAFENACRIRAKLVSDAASVFEHVDVIVAPTLCTGAPVSEENTVNEMYDAYSLTLPANVTGQPAVAIPGRLFGRETDPGLQLIAPRLHDARLLSIAAYLLSVKKGES